MLVSVIYIRTYLRDVKREVTKKERSSESEVLSVSVMFPWNCLAAGGL